MKSYMLILFFSIASIYCFAGEVTGIVKVSSTNALVDNGYVTIFNSGYKRSTNILLSGDYSFSGLSAGTYTIAAYSEGLVDTITGVVVNNEGVTYVELKLIESLKMLGGVTKTISRGYTRPIIDPYIIHPELITTPTEIKNMGHLTVTEIVTVNTGVSVNENNEISIRGSRPTATRMMIDGVYSQVTVPTTAIKYIQVYTGGIPAKYGDTSGGIIVIETKGFYDNN